MDVENTVKLALYQLVAEEAQMPDASAIAEQLHLSVEEVESAFERLFAKRLLVLEERSKSQIRMAPPFSGVVTQHRVKIGDKQFYANCAWDSFGIAAALHADADIESTCGDCGEVLEFQIRRNQAIALQSTIAHFAVPSALWWKDIIYT